MNDLFMNLFRRLRLLPVLIVVSALTFMVRVGDAVMQVRDLSGAAMAQEKQQEKPEAGEAKEKPAPAADQKEGGKVMEAIGAEPPKEELDDASKKALKDKDGIKLPTAREAAKNEKKWEDSESEIDDEKIRKEVYDDLQQRRQLIEQKEKDLAQREALLKAGTEEINKKVEELNSIKTEIQSLLKKQNTEEEENTARLVKIYEGMKPKDAARIFNQLDMDVLLSVVTKMSERKVSPVIALMDPEKARSLTLFLSEQNKLPGANEMGRADPAKPPAIPETELQ